MSSQPQQSTTTNQFLDMINTEFEHSFEIAVSTSIELNCIYESKLAAKRVFSYNTNSEKILKLFPEYESPIKQISQLVDSRSQMIKDNASNLEQWMILGCCYLTIGDFPNAFSAYAHALRINNESNDPTFWYAVGIVYAHFKYSEHALNCFQKAFEIDENYKFKYDIFLRMAFIQRSLQKYDNALNLLEKCIKTPPGNLLTEDIRLQIAYTYQLMDNVDEALRIYKELHTRFPNCVKMTQQYCWYFYTIYKNTDLNAVRDVVNKALESNPCDPILLIISARIAMKLNDTTTAYANFRYCGSYCSDSPYYWSVFGLLYYNNDQKDDAVVAFQRALYLKCEMHELWLNLGLIYEQKADYPTALKIYNIGQSKCPNCTEFIERINCAQARSRPPDTLIDIDDSKFITSIPEQFAADYIAAVPELPPECYGISVSAASSFASLSTYPKSIFI